MSTTSFSSYVSWACLAVPALYLVAAGLASAAARRGVVHAWRVASGLSLAAVAAALALAIATPSLPALADPLRAFLPGTSGDGRWWSVRTDALTSVGLLLVTFIGWVVVRFSRRYLDGDPRQLPYLRRLLLTLSAVTALVSSNNLLGIALLWLATSVSLHGLLTHFSERAAAQVAAHKKFLLSRLADLCLLGAVSLIASSVHSLELDRIFEAVRQTPGLPTPLAIGSLLIAFSVLLKCSQLPFHGWLIQVMEAPTPVSALLHAGVVNIGGFLLIRLAPLMSHASLAQLLLLVVGLATAIAASLVMLTRISVKVMLAWSTCAQMGLMLVECALGAYEMALLHLVAHSLYKAHAFLSAGGAVATQRVLAMAPASGRSSVGTVLAAGAVCLVALSAGLTSAGVDIVGQPAHWFPITLLGLALPSLLLNAPTLRSAKLGRVLAVAVGVSACFAAGHVAFENLLPPGVALGATATAPAAFAVIGLLALFLAHAWLRLKPDSRLAVWLYPHAFAGFHLDELVTRLTFRLWPAKLPSLLPAPLALTQAQESTLP